MVRSNLHGQINEMQLKNYKFKSIQDISKGVRWEDMNYIQPVIFVSKISSLGGVKKRHMQIDVLVLYPHHFACWVH